MYEQPIEDFIQYTDIHGITYVASKPNDLEPWFDEMIERHGLPNLTHMFPYVTLVLDKETGMLKTWKPCNYNARVTNAFHILLAQELDKRYQQDNQQEFPLDLERFFPKVDIPEERNIEYDIDNILLKDNELYEMTNDLPEYITIKNPPPNSHPNKDSYGNYRVPKSNFPSYAYRYNSYLPQYSTFGNRYPF